MEKTKGEMMTVEKKKKMMKTKKWWRRMKAFEYHYDV
jgi:hypothetical protein